MGNLSLVGPLVCELHPTVHGHCFRGGERPPLVAPELIKQCCIFVIHIDSDNDNDNDIENDNCNDDVKEKANGDDNDNDKGSHHDDNDNEKTQYKNQTLPESGIRVWKLQVFNCHNNTKIAISIIAIIKRITGMSIILLLIIMRTTTIITKTS